MSAPTLRRSQRELAAHHEAGHAAALWFLGALETLRTLELGPDGGGALVGRLDFLRTPEQLAGLPPDLAGAFARRGLLFYLAGPCAEAARLEPDAGESWLGRDAWYRAGAWRGDDEDDYRRAADLAAAAAVSLEAAGGWVWRCLRLPAVRGVRRRLAVALERRGRLEAGDVRRLLGAAAGPPPWQRSGPEWRAWLAFPWRSG